MVCLLQGWLIIRMVDRYKGFSCRSMDGCTLMVTSTDGFCSIVSFEKEELGVPAPQLLASVPDAVGSSPAPTAQASTSGKDPACEATITLPNSLIKRKTVPAPTPAMVASPTGEASGSVIYATNRSGATGPGGLVGSEKESSVDAMDVDKPVEEGKANDLAKGVPETKKRRIAPTFISST